MKGKKIAYLLVICLLVCLTCGCETTTEDEANESDVSSKVSISSDRMDRIELNEENLELYINEEVQLSILEAFSGSLYREVYLDRNPTLLNGVHLIMK